MKRIALIALASLLGGCVVAVGNHTPDPAPSQAAAGPHRTADAKTLAIDIDSSGNMLIDGWRITEADLAGAVQNQHPMAAVIRGQKYAPYDKALQAQGALHKLGIADVRIEMAQ